MEIKTKASESIHGKEREQAYLKNPDSLQRTIRVLCTHTQLGQQLKYHISPRKGIVYGLSASASTPIALFRCQRGTVNIRVARNSSHHNILIHDLNAIYKDKIKANLKSTFFFFFFQIQRPTQG